MSIRPTKKPTIFCISIQKESVKGNFSFFSDDFKTNLYKIRQKRTRQQTRKTRENMTKHLYVS